MLLWFFVGSVFAVFGSLLVSVPTRDGLVICGDKRQYDRIRGDTDETVKIVQIGKYSAYGHTGTGTFLRLPDFAVVWKPDTVTQSYFSNREVAQANWSEFASMLRETFIKDYLAKRLVDQWPATANTIEAALFQLVFFYLTNESTPNVTVLSFQYTKSPQFNIQIEKLEYSKPEALGFGNPAVWNELKNGTDTRFEALRKHPLVVRFIRPERLDPQAISSSDALEFGKFIIKVTSERTSLIENTTFHVSPNCDCAIIRPTTGFELTAVDLQQLE